MACEYNIQTHMHLLTLLTPGRFHGHGVLHFPDGGTFETRWENGRAVGLATGVSLINMAGLAMSHVLRMLVAVVDCFCWHRLLNGILINW